MSPSPTRDGFSTGDSNPSTKRGCDEASSHGTRSHGPGLPPNGTNHPLHIGSLPGGAWRGQNFADAHVSHLFSEVLAEDGIAVAQQVARELVEGKRLPQLLSCPLRGRMRGHIAVQYAPPLMGQDQKHVQDLETEDGHGEEVEGDQLPEAIVQEVRQICEGGLR